MNDSSKPISQGGPLRVLICDEPPRFHGPQFGPSLGDILMQREKLESRITELERENATLRDQLDRLLAGETSRA